MYFLSILATSSTSSSLSATCTMFFKSSVNTMVVEPSPRNSFIFSLKVGMASLSCSPTLCLCSIYLSTPNAVAEKRLRARISGKKSYSSICKVIAENLQLLKTLMNNLGVVLRPLNKQSACKVLSTTTTKLLSLTRGNVLANLFCNMFNILLNSVVLTENSILNNSGLAKTSKPPNSGNYT